MVEQVKSFKGVNLGGWLVIEKWITPELFNGTEALDEYNLSQSKNAKKKIERHRKTFITSEDFRWLAQNDFKYVRIPIGYWILGGKQPFHGGLEHLDFAFEQAKLHKLKILIDLHGLPGSQNGEQHSGRAGETEWHLGKININASLEFLTQICIRYGKHKSLWAIEVINEPNRRIPIPILTDYYSLAIKIIRKYCPDEIIAVVSDSFRSKQMVKALKRQNIDNVILDMHFYQTYSFMDKLLGFKSTLWMVKYWGRKISRAQKHYQVIVGEWSGGLGIGRGALARTGKKEITREYIHTQQYEYGVAAGWFYWNYKVETNEPLNPWNLKNLVEMGIIKSPED